MLRQTLILVLILFALMLLYGWIFGWEMLKYVIL